MKKIEKPEVDYYNKIKTNIEGIFKAKFEEAYFETTAQGKFSTKLKSQIGQYRDIIFFFLKKGNSPDITGFVKNLKEEFRTKYGYGYDGFVITEVKKDEIKLEDIYQARRYAELFDARYSFLISLEPIPEEIKRLSKAVYSLLSLPAYRTLTLVYFDDKVENFIEWFPEKPFKDE